MLQALKSFAKPFWKDAVFSFSWWREAGTQHGERHIMSEDTVRFCAHLLLLNLYSAVSCSLSFFTCEEMGAWNRKEIPWLSESSMLERHPYSHVFLSTIPNSQGMESTCAHQQKDTVSLQGPGPVIYSSVNEPGGHYIEFHEPGTERQMPHS